MITLDKLKEEIKAYQKKVLDVQLAYATSKDKESKTCKEINSEVKKIALVQIVANKLQSWMRALGSTDTKRFLQEVTMLAQQQNGSAAAKSAAKPGIVPVIQEIIDTGKEMRLQVNSKGKDSIEIKVGFFSFDQIIIQHSSTAKKSKKHIQDIPYPIHL